MRVRARDPSMELQGRSSSHPCRLFSGLPCQRGAPTDTRRCLRARGRHGPGSTRGRRAGKENAFADLPHSLEAVEVDGAAQPLGLAEPVHKVRRYR